MLCDSECETLMMPLFARYDLTDASGYRLRLLFISSCSNGGTRSHTCEIEDSRCGGEVIRLVAPSGTIAQYPGLGAASDSELGELVATLPRRVLSDSGK